MIFAELRRRLDSGQARQMALKAALLLCVVIVFNDFDSQHRFTAALKNWSHVAVFFLASNLLLDLLREWIGQRRLRLIGTALFCLGIGAGIELIQPYFGRDRSLLDLVYDGVGIGAALLFHLAHETRKSGLRVLGLAVLIVSTYQPAYFGTMVLARSWAVPYLAGFEHFWEQDFWRVGEHTQVSIEPAPSGGHWLRVQMEGGAYPGVAFAEMHPDWRGYDALALRVFSSQPQPVKLVIRIHDAQHNNDYADRFNQSVLIQPGMNDLAISLINIATAPKNRRMDLSQIESLMLFTISPDQPISLYVDQIRLI